MFFSRLTISSTQSGRVTVLLPPEHSCTSGPVSLPHGLLLWKMGVEPNPLGVALSIATMGEEGLVSFWQWTPTSGLPRRGEGWRSAPTSAGTYLPTFLSTYLTRLRRARPGLVANQEQYRLVYSLVEEALVCGDNSRSLAQLKSSASQDLTEEFLLVNKVQQKKPSAYNPSCLLLN